MGSEWASGRIDGHDASLQSTDKEEGGEIRPILCNYRAEWVYGVVLVKSRISGLQRCALTASDA